MKTLLASVLLLLTGFAAAKPPEGDFRQFPLARIIVPELEFDLTPLDEALQILEREVNEAKRGGNPVKFKIAPDSKFINPSVHFSVRNVDLLTLIQFLTEHVGYDWAINGKTIVLFTNQEMREHHRKLIAMPGRPKLQATKVEKFKAEGLEMAEALRQLQIVAQASGLGEILPGARAMQIVTNYQPRPGNDYVVRGEFDGSSVDTILEILTKQTKKLDWTIRDGHVLVFDKEQAKIARARAAAERDAARRPSSGAVDPFASLDSGISAPRPSPKPPPVAPANADPNFNTESYQNLRDNPFLSPLNEPLSTFSIDVDTASYANIRRYLFEHGSQPPIGAVRIEEMINYFDYDYAPPAEIGNPTNERVPVEHPFAAQVEVAASPWKSEHRLVRVGLKGYELPPEKRPPSNLVFLLDVSGSMSAPNKLPLVKQSLTMLLDRLNERDRVAIVVYAGASGLVLDSTPCSRRDLIRDSLLRLQSGGGTNGGEGIRLAYNVAKANFAEGGNNRVILCTDGDFNVGTTDNGELTRLVAEKAKDGIQLSIFGFGTGNLNDELMESLSNNGDGNYGYIDSRAEAEKLFVNRIGGTLFMIAKDVKIQVEFNPRHVAAYRLIGYENRLLKNRDFADDTIDAGDIGAGHTVTALYEIVPPGVPLPEQPGKIDLKYQRADLTSGEDSDELLTLKLRYKWPDQVASRLMTFPVVDQGTTFEDATSDFQFASAVAGFGMLLRDSPHCGELAFEDVAAIGKANLGNDPYGDRKQFVELTEIFFW